MTEHRRAPRSTDWGGGAFRADRHAGRHGWTVPLATRLEKLHPLVVLPSMKLAVHSAQVPGLGLGDPLIGRELGNLRASSVDQLGIGVR